jgi:hypothetical protein
MAVGHEAGQSGISGFESAAHAHKSQHTGVGTRTQIENILDVESQMQNLLHSTSYNAKYFRFDTLKLQCVLRSAVESDRRWPIESKGFCILRVKCKRF